MLPKPIIDKISNFLEGNKEKDKDGRDGKNGKFQGKHLYAPLTNIMEAMVKGSKT